VISREGKYRKTKSDLNTVEIKKSEERVELVVSFHPKHNTTLLQTWIHGFLLVQKVVTIFSTSHAFTIYNNFLCFLLIFEGKSGREREEHKMNKTVTKNIQIFILFYGKIKPSFTLSRRRSKTSNFIS
jgi:hypothetical protein